MTIPELLRSVLAGDPAMLGAVTLSMDEFLPVVRAATMDFFPEYTDHGLDHLEGVLKTASSLIADDAWAVLSPKDAAVLILAVLLHDAGMHITPEGFSALLRSDWRIDHLDTQSWQQLWMEYLDDARRFDGRKLTRLFGDTTPILAIELDPARMILRDRLAIGEFLRRHHHRLAHEIACFGFPGISTAAPRLQGVDTDMADLIGTVARSHGVALRSLLPYLIRRHHQPREYQQVHAVFLMGVLRVADYLQIEAERAPRQQLTIRRLSSPLSKGEWTAHGAIRNILKVHDDPEAIFVDARPSDVGAFFRIKELLDGIQAELDSTWAVFGEVYRRYDELKTLGLSLRRVRSNLEDVASFSREVSYLPLPAAFESADPDLLKLLVTPLYGDRPEIGIREPLQNALDAVRERARVDKTFQPATGDVSIVLDLSKDPPTLTITDRGIGMTAAIVTDYFLRAGASFRRSDAWRRMFEDHKGQSTVLRSGRFGIGVLAAFLLGDEVHVRTRHLRSAEGGFEFRATLDSELVQLNKIADPDMEIGTRIVVSLRPGVIGKLMEFKRHAQRQSTWDFHCLAHPSVTRTYIDVHAHDLPQAYHLPAAGDALPPHWHRVEHPDYQEIHWTYARGPALVCNGILVEETPVTRREGPRLDEPYSLSLAPPCISVFDPNGNLPLTLQRDRLSTRDFPFARELYDDVARDCIAHALSGSREWPHRFLKKEWSLGVPLFETHYDGLIAPDCEPRLDPWAYAPEGFTLRTSWHLHNCGVSRVVIPVKPLYGRGGHVPSISHGVIVRALTKGGIDGLAEWLLFALRVSLSRPVFNHDVALNQLAVLGTRAFVRTDLMSKAIKKLPDTLTRLIRVAAWDDLSILTVGECPRDSSETSDWRHWPSLLEREEQRGFSGGLLGIAEWFLDERKTPPTDPLSRVWAEHVGCRLIPYEHDIRQSELAHSFASLYPYLAKCQARRGLSGPGGRA